MFLQKKTINNVPQFIHLTADTGTGAPVGSIIVVCSNILPSGYLGLGVQYDITNYPALYQVLGTDTTPTASSLGLPTLSSGQYAIKATSGLTENQQENVLNTINENNSYSTEEHPTGKKWIDGKDIYRKVFYSATNWGGVSGTVGTIPANSNIVSIRSICTDNANNVTENYFYTSGASDLNLNQAYYSPNGDIRTLRGGIFETQKPSTVIVEYTKTTD